jgi:hypothetical protein
MRIFSVVRRMPGSLFVIVSTAPVMMPSIEAFGFNCDDPVFFAE